MKRGIKISCLIPSWLVDVTAGPLDEKGGEIHLVTSLCQMLCNWLFSYWLLPESRNPGPDALALRSGAFDSTIAIVLKWAVEFLMAFDELRYIQIKLAREERREMIIGVDNRSMLSVRDAAGYFKLPCKTVYSFGVTWERLNYYSMEQQK